VKVEKGIADVNPNQEKELLEMGWRQGKKTANGGIK
jgi:hypothetical protein